MATSPQTAEILDVQGSPIFPGQRHRSKTPFKPGLSKFKVIPTMELPQSRQLLRQDPQKTHWGGINVMIPVKGIAGFPRTVSVCTFYTEGAVTQDGHHGLDRKAVSKELQLYKEISHTSFTPQPGS